MRLSRTSIQNAVAGVALGTGLIASTTQAGLVYDLRFADGSHTKDPASAASFTVELWARVSGTNATQTDEGLTNSYVEILSTQTGGGGITAGGLSAGVLALGFNEAGSRAGGSTQINADGIADWGTTATAAANTFYMLARNATVGGASAGATLGAAVDAITWEFKLATFTIDVGGVGTGSTSFNIIQPNAKATVGAQTYATAKIDNATFNVTSTAPGTTYTGSTGVTFGAIPEPASIGLLGAAAVGLLGRRRA